MNLNYTMARKEIIITHGGDAHTDETFACAIYVLGRNLAPHGTSQLKYNIVRGGERITGDHHVLIDVGMVYDPERKRFDHHQDKELPASVEMVADAFYPELMEADGIFARFVRRISLQDRFGPMESSRKMFRTSRDLTGPLGSYIAVERWIVKRFAVDPNLTTMLITVPMLQDLIETEKQLVHATEWWKLHGIVSKVQADHGEITILTPDRKPPFSPFNTGCTAMVRDNAVDIVHTFSDRNQSILFKSERTRKRIDFTLCQGMKGVEFIHPNGFLMGMSRKVGGSIDDLVIASHF